MPKCDRMTRAGPLVFPHPTLTASVGDGDLTGVRVLASPASPAPTLFLSFSPFLADLEGILWGGGRDTTVEVGNTVVGRGDGRWQLDGGWLWGHRNRGHL